jgi:hypothetical protein
MCTTKQTAAFLVLGGEVAAGIDPQLVLLETADGQLDLLRVDQLDGGWFGLVLDDGLTRRLHAPMRLHQHQRDPLRRVRTAIVGRRTVLPLLGQRHEQQTHHHN